MSPDSWSEQKCRGFEVQTLWACVKLNNDYLNIHLVEHMFSVNTVIKAIANKVQYEKNTDWSLSRTIFRFYWRFSWHLYIIISIDLILISQMLCFSHSRVYKQTAYMLEISGQISINRPTGEVYLLQYIDLNKVCNKIKIWKRTRRSWKLISYIICIIR